MVARKDKGRKAVEQLANRLHQLKVEYVPAASLSPNTYNPNRQSDHEFHLLLRSMDDDGFTQPILVHRQSRQIVDGEHRWTGAIVHHHVTRGRTVPLAGVSETEIAEARNNRLGALREAGDDLLIPVVFVDMTPEQMRVATLRHNRARGSEDMELGVQVLRDLQEMGALEWAQASLLLDDAEVQRLLQDVSAPESLAGDEFSAAWAPGHEETVESREQQVGDEVNLTAATQQAVERQRQLERRLKEAVTDEERTLARQQLRVHRVSLVFTGEEAEVIKKVLGDRPAEALLHLCLGVIQDRAAEAAGTAAGAAAGAIAVAGAAEVIP